MICMFYSSREDEVVPILGKVNSRLEHRNKTLNTRPLHLKPNSLISLCNTIPFSAMLVVPGWWLIIKHQEDRDCIDDDFPSWDLA